MSPSEFSKIEKLNLCGLIILIGFTFAVFFHYIQGFYLLKSYPFNTYLFVPSDHLADWGGAFEFSKTLDPFHTLYRGQGNNYPPFGYLISAPFAILGFKLGRLIFTASFMLGLLYFCWKFIVDQSQALTVRLAQLLIFSIMSYPVQFALDRLNAENALFLLFLGYYLAYFYEKTQRAAWFLGATMAAKVYPGFAMLLFLRERKYKAICICVLSAVISTGLALVIFRTSPMEALKAYRISAPSFHAQMWNFSITNHSSSIFSLVRIFQAKVLHSPDLPEFANQNLVDTSLYFFSLFIVIPIVAMTFATMSKKIDQWECLTLVVSGMLLLTPVSFDYKLLYLLFPFASFLNSKTERKTSVLFCVFFGLLFIPKDYIVIVEDVTSNGVINVIVLSIMFVMLVKKGLSPLKQ